MSGKEAFHSLRIILSLISLIHFSFHSISCRFLNFVLFCHLSSLVCSMPKISTILSSTMLHGFGSHENLNKIFCLRPGLNPTWYALLRHSGDPNQDFMGCGYFKFLSDSFGMFRLIKWPSNSQLLRLTHTSGLSYGCGFGEEPSDATERGYAKLVKAVDQGSVRWAIGFFDAICLMSQVTVYETSQKP